MAAEDWMWDFLTTDLYDELEDESLFATIEQRSFWTLIDEVRAYERNSKAIREFDRRYGSGRSGSSGDAGVQAEQPRLRWVARQAIRYVGRNSFLHRIQEARRGS